MRGVCSNVNAVVIAFSLNGDAVWLRECERVSSGLVLSAGRRLPTGGF